MSNRILLTIGAAVLFSSTLASAMTPAKPTPTTPDPAPSVIPSPVPPIPPKPPKPPTPPSPVGVYLERVKAIASQSACNKVSWEDRGRSPSGYLPGMALTYARSLCRAKGLAPLTSAGAMMSRASSGRADKDVAAHYEETFNDQGLRVDRDGVETLRSIYTLAVGLGMRESSGRYCAGRDTTAKNPSSTTAETGLFQVSYNSYSASSELKGLYTEYQAHPEKCALEVFKAGVNPDKGDCAYAPYGSGDGAAFQKFTRSCPAFAAEYAATLMRVLRKHWGPINRHEAQVLTSCSDMILEVQRFIEEDPRNACAALQ